MDNNKIRNYQGDAFIIKAASPKRKSKPCAIILAVIFSSFGWLYTYKKSKLKFWIAAPMGIFLTFICYTIIPYMLFRVSYMDVIVFQYVVVVFGLRLWAVIDVSIKPREFYTEYPNR
jgi:hypothetical protein